MNLSKRLRQWWRKQVESPGKPWGILLVLGLLMAVIVWPVGNDREGEEENTFSEVSEGGGYVQGADSLTYEKQLEEKLASILSKVKGAGMVEVMIMLESSSELVLQMDEQKSEEMVREEAENGQIRDSSQSAYTKETVLTGSTDGPYVVKEINPKVSGVLVLAQGAGSAAVKNEICEAVEALFNLPIHKIKVLEAE